MTRASEALAWLGRQGTRAIAASIFIGLALPPLAAAFKPFAGAAIFCLLVIAFLRVAPAALRGIFARPLLLLLATFWTMVATPLALGTAYGWLGGSDEWNELSLALILQAATAPVTAVPAFALLLGLDGAFALAALVAAMVVTPVTAPLFADYFAGTALPLDPVSLAVRLALFLGGSFLVATAIRRAAGAARLSAWRERLDGLSVIALFVFAVALMESVSSRLFSDPGLVFALLGLSFILAFGLMGLTALLFWPAGPERALALGLLTGMRNMGLMLAVAGELPDLVWLYFALAQFPVYLAPQLISPIVSRLLRSRLPAGR